MTSISIRLDSLDTISRAYVALSVVRGYGRGYGFGPTCHKVQYGDVLFRFYFGGQANDGARAYASAAAALVAYSDALKAAGLVVTSVRTNHDAYGWYTELAIPA